MLPGWSIVSASVRVLVGYLCDRFTNSVSRPVWLLVGALIMLIAMMLPLMALELGGGITYDLTLLLWTCSLFNGFGYGVAFAMSNTLVVFLFGVRSMGRNWSANLLSAACAGFLVTGLNREWTSHCVQRAADNLSTDGLQCYRNTLIFCVVLAFIAALLSLDMASRYRSLQLPLNRLDPVSTVPLSANKLGQL